MVKDSSLRNLEVGKVRAIDAAPGELGKVIGTRYPADVEAALSRLSPAERSAFIRRWVAKGLESEGLL